MEPVDGMPRPGVWQDPFVSFSYPDAVDVVDLRPGATHSLSDLRRARLGGCLVDLVPAELLDRLLDGHLGRPPGTGTLLVGSANLDHLTYFAHRPDGEALDPGRMDDWLVLLDGAPLVRAASRLTGTEYPRLTGADILPDLFALAERRNRSVVVLGGRPQLRRPFAEAVGRRWPGLNILDHLTPSRGDLVDPVASLRIRDGIAALEPELLVVCLGKPLQERWMREHARGTGARVAVAFGAAIDFVAGSVPRAPRWMQDRGLEWSYRLLREPTRMASRYLVRGPIALVRLRSDRELLLAARSGEVAAPGPDAAVLDSAGAGGGVRHAGNGARPAGTSRPSCSAVVVTHQSAAHVGGLLRVLQAERDAGLDLNVTVVDNASTDGTPDAVSGFGWPTVVDGGGNAGYAAGVNAGDRLAPAGHPLFVLNPDLVPAPGALSTMLDALDTPGVGVVVPRLEDGDGVLYPSLRYEPSLCRAVVDALFGGRAARLPRGWSGMVWQPQAYDTTQSPDWATGAALLVSADCRAAVGAWDERYFLYSEETDFLRRVRAAGLRIRYVPGAVVRHEGAGSGNSDALHALFVVNSVRYYRRYHARVPGQLFGVVVAAGELVRARRPRSRLALRALLSRRTRSRLPGPTTRTRDDDPGPVVPRD